MYTFYIHCVCEEPLSSDMDMFLVWKSDVDALGMLMLFSEMTSQGSLFVLVTYKL